MNFSGRDIITIEDFSKEEILYILNKVDVIKEKKNTNHLRKTDWQFVLHLLSLPESSLLQKTE